MSQPLFTFTPDGVRMYSIVAPSSFAVQTLLGVFLAVLLALALALVKLAELVAGVVTFFLTAPEGVLLRLVGIVIALALSVFLVSLARVALARKVGM